METFDHESLSDCLKKGIYAYGWESPSPIQQQAVPAILSGKDVILQSQSGTGKTGAFSIGVLAKVQPDLGEIQAMVVLNTRELATQVYQVMASLAHYMEINVVRCIGKNRVARSLENSDRATVLVGTPGKLLDLHRRSNSFFDQPFNLQTIVIDEFDQMLDTNFQDDLADILRLCQSDGQIVLSSATISPQVRQMTQLFLQDPIEISVQKEQLTLEGIRQFYVNCEQDQYKFPTILEIFQSLIITQCILFVNSRSRCERLEKQFRDHDFTVSILHGGLEQSERDQIMKEFRNGTIRILLSTDLTARGIDVQQVSLVINYDIPRDKEQYLHRIGRSGRYGRKGCAINLLGDYRETARLREIEMYYSTQIEELPANFVQIIGGST